MNWELFLTDSYFSWLVAHYTILIFTVIPWGVMFILKLWAILSPKAPANAIMELFTSMWPGGKKVIVNDTPLDVIK